MTRDWNAALKIFKMALSVAMMRLKYKGIFSYPSYESEDEMAWESEKVLEKHDVDVWAEGMKEEEGKRKRDVEGGVDVTRTNVVHCERVTTFNLQQ
jgi:hypothetical protein